MKKLILLFVPLFIIGCTNQPEESLTETLIEAENNSVMENSPCHEMPDGSMMGDCPEEEDHVDEEGALPHRH